MSKHPACVHIVTAQPARFFYPASLLVMAVCLPMLGQAPQPETDSLKAAAANPLAVFPKDRLLRPIDESAWTTIPGGVHSQARPEFDSGPTPAGTTIFRMTLALRRSAEQQAAVDAFSEAVQNPGSPLYHQWLTPQQFGQHFGLAQNDLDRVSAWLKTKGFTIDETPPGHWTIVFSGTVAQVEAAFHTSIHNYTLPRGTFFANAIDPQVPQALGSMVFAIIGLNNFPVAPAASAPSASPQGVLNGGHYLDPSDFYTIYDMNPLYAKGLSGKGVNIAVIETCTFDDSLASQYWALEGVASQGLWFTNYGTPPTCSASATDEVYLDIEWAQAVAPGATVWLVAAQGGAFTAIQDVINFGLVNNTFAPVMSMSFSTCGNSQSFVQSVNATWQQAHTEGITGLVASGDWGAAACDAGDPQSQTTATHGISINDYCQAIYVTCVGGTEFNDFSNPGQYWSPAGRALAYIPEVAWNDTAGSNIFGATGGGFSVLNAKPSWQTNNSTNFRGVPDVSLSASGAHDAYRVCLATLNFPCNSSNVQTIGGTSAAAPALSGIIALLVQQSGAQGSVNQTMYALAARNDVGLIFHDVTSGNNSVAGQQGYNAGPGWDPVTGLGSIDANAMLTNWGNAFAPEAVLSSNDVNLGSQPVGKTSASQTITLTNQEVAPSLSGGVASLNVSSVKLGGNNPNDFPSNTTCVAANLGAGANCTITVTFQPTASGVRTATVTLVDNAPNSPQVINLTGTGGSGNAAPAITSLSPASATAGGPAFQLTVNGTNFIAGAVVQWNGSNLPTTFSSSTQLLAAVGANLIASAGTVSVTVSSGGQISAAATFTIGPASGSGPTVVTKEVSNANGIVNGACVTPPNVTSFTTASPAVWVYFFITGGVIGTPVNINFIRPDGTVYTTIATTNQFASACFSYFIDINGQPAANFPGNWTAQILWNNSPLFSLNFTISTPGSTSGNYFVPVTPCRLVDTRNAASPFGGPSMAGGASRDFAIPNAPCGIPSSATAYSLNVTVVPHGPLGYLTIWPSGQSQPGVSTLNSLDGRIKANAAIVPAGSNGAVSVFVTNSADIILDINGYFAAENTSGALALYPLTPCRIADTRNANGSFGGPMLGGNSTRTFPILSSSCGVPSSAEAYSLNFTAVPGAGLGFLSTWPAGSQQPLVSSLNDPTGTIAANAVIVPSGTNGSVNVFSSDNTNLVMDINGYFAPPGSGGLALYTLPPCRVLDTRTNPGAPVNAISVNVVSSACGLPATAKAFVFNATVVPVGALGFLTLWPDGQTQPLVSTLNAPDGAITSNMAIVPTSNGAIDVFASPFTQLILDISGYFAP